MILVCFQIRCASVVWVCLFLVSTIFSTIKSKKVGKWHKKQTTSNDMKQPIMQLDLLVAPAIPCHTPPLQSHRWWAAQYHGYQALQRLPLRMKAKNGAQIVDHCCFTKTDLKNYQSKDKVWLVLNYLPFTYIWIVSLVIYNTISLNIKHQIKETVGSMFSSEPPLWPELATLFPMHLINPTYRHILSSVHQRIQ